MSYEVVAADNTTSVAEIEIDNDGGSNYMNGRNYLLTYYIKVTQTAILGTLQLAFRWNDGTANRILAPTAVVLAGLNVINGAHVIRLSDDNPIPRPTYEILLVGFGLGSPIYDYRITLKLQSP